MSYSRRRFAKWLGALLGGFSLTGARAIASSQSSSRANGAQPDPAGKTITKRTEIRRYRADAAILALGITIFKRSGVGSGQASIEETSDGASTKRTLFFAAGSDPARAHGLDRLGWIREMVTASKSTPVDLRYFGVLTASPEENLAHARKSIATKTASSSYSAVNGHNTPGRSRSAITHFDLAGGAKWSDKRLIDAAESTFDGKVDWRETSWPNTVDQPPPSFLLELSRLLAERIPHAVGWYVYNEQEYVLELDTPQNGKPGRAERLLAVHGKIRNQRTNVVTAFTVWREAAPGSIVPTRIEYQPRSFLRLIFEAVDA